MIDNTQNFKTFTILVIAIFIISCKTNKQLENGIPNGNINIEEFNKALKAYESYGFSGGIMVEKNDKIIYSEAYGYADYDKKVKNKTTTLFDLGSVTKQFTAVAILKLEQEKKISILDSLGYYFKNLSIEKAGITIQQLLNHTSGLEKDPSFKEDSFLFSKDIPKILEKTKLVNHPKEKFNYSNFGYCILGFIIEKVTGQSYQNYIESEFFKPLNMLESKFYNPKLSKNFSFGHETLDFKKQKVNPYSYTDIPVWEGGASGIVTNLNDMNIWFTSLFNDKVINKTAYQKLITPLGVASAIENPYAFGLRVINWKDQKVIFHDGDTNGHQIKFIYFPETGYRFLFYINNRDRWKNKIEKLIYSSILKETIDILPIPDFDIKINTIHNTKDFAIKKIDNKYFILALSQEGVLKLSESELTLEKANHLNSLAQTLAQSIISNNVNQFEKFIDTTKISAKERMQKIKNDLEYAYNDVNVLGTAPWRTNIFQSFIKFSNEDKFEVIRFVWHPKKDELLFYGGGKNELISRVLYPIDSSTFIIFDPKEETYKSITINERGININ